MSKTAILSVGRAFAERAVGDHPGPVRAAVAATITGAATAALTYRVLRGSLGGSD